MPILFTSCPCFYIFYIKKREMGFGKKKSGLSHVNAWIKSKSRKSSRKKGVFMNYICIITKITSLMKQFVGFFDWFEAEGINLLECRKLDERVSGLFRRDAESMACCSCEQEEAPAVRLCRVKRVAKLEHQAEHEVFLPARSAHCCFRSWK